ncbi:ankyrin repeat-containing domain protein [Bisporella sp. PMI_857]|nr:ankyrin repeat-containing domain protein [Bisporella sp. PMI_857]
MDVNFLQDDLQYGMASYSLLNWAIEMKATSLAELLIQKGVDCSLQTKYNARKWSAIQTACFFGCEKDLFEELLSRSTAIHEPDAEGNYLPHLTCLKESQADVHLLRALCNRDIDLNSQDIQFRTPLMVAAQARREDAVSLLLEKGADASVMTAFGWNLICFAISGGGPVILEQLLSLDLDWTVTVSLVVPGRTTATKCNVLHQACLSGNFGTIDFILRHGFIKDVNLLNGEGWSAMHIAAAYASTAIVEILIKFGANLDCAMRNGQRPIHCAAIHDNIETTRTLLKHGCLLVSDSRGITPEISALRFGHMEVVEALRQHKAGQDVTSNGNVRQPNSILDRSHIEALSIASRTGDLSLCQEVLGKLQISDNLLSHCSGCNPVSIALVHSHPAVAEYLVDKEVQTTGTLCDVWGNLCGYSALHLASRSGSCATVLKKLLGKISGESSAFRAAVTPLHIAVACQNLKGLEILLHWVQERDSPKHTNFDERGGISASEPAKNIRDHNPTSTLSASPDRRPWRYTDSSFCDTKIENVNLSTVWDLSFTPGQKDNSHPLNTNTREMQGATALLIAAFRNNIDAAKMLLQHGANVHACNHIGATALHIAAYNGFLGFIRVLVEHKARLNDCDHAGATATTLAAQYGHNLVLEYLVSNGASLQYKDVFGRTMLHLASLSSPQALSHLLIQGCNPYAKTIQRSFPLDIAINTVHLGGGKTMFLLLNWSLDFALFDGTISSRRYGQDDRFKPIRALFKRIPISLISREIDKSTRIEIKDSPLLQAVRGGCLKILDLLIRYGADLNHEGGQNGPALHAACRWGRFPVVKYLVRAGAKQSIHKDGKLFAVIDEAKEYPEIVRWLLVERHTEQPKICWAPGSSDYDENEIAR